MFHNAGGRTARTFTHTHSIVKLQCGINKKKYEPRGLQLKKRVDVRIIFDFTDPEMNK